MRKTAEPGHGGRQGLRATIARWRAAAASPDAPGSVPSAMARCIPLPEGKSCLPTCSFESRGPDRAGGRRIRSRSIVSTATTPPSRPCRPCAE
jgi:hypothetical protein